jgi:hypothetical protein
MSRVATLASDKGFNIDMRASVDANIEVINPLIASLACSDVSRG